jgi:hypothetical protein
MRLGVILLTLGLLVMSIPSASFCEETLSPAEGGRIPLSNVAGKKLIRGAREIRHVCGELEGIEDAGKKAAFLNEKVATWQDKGIDGVMFVLRNGQWWRVPALTYEDVKPEIDAFQSVNDWGRLTDNFLWTSSTLWVEGRVPDWFNNDDWEAMCTNTRLAARVAKECGFKGVLLDLEQYGGRGSGVWKYPFHYKGYADEGYKAAGEAAPRSFHEVAAKVRQRGEQYGEALTKEYPQIVLMVAASLYEGAYRVALRKELERESKGSLLDTGFALMPAFFDGLLAGLDERASLVSACEATYLDSTYKDMLVVRDQALRLAPSLSTTPELARKRISFCTAIWTDAGWGEDRFSPTDVRANQRDPVRHKHAAHNAMAASDKYAWLYGEMPWITAEPTPLTRKYWQANIDAHQPQDLSWKPTPKWDLTDYTEHDRQMAARDTAFWAKAKQDGWRVAAELPEFWHFRFDTQLQIRYNKHWYRPNNDFDFGTWPLISTLKCWQSQGTKANGVGIYRIKFDVPQDLDPQRDEIMLAFSGHSAGTSPGPGLRPEIIALMNTKRGLGMKTGLTDVSEVIKPGASNQVSVRVINHAGPAGLMGHVKLLVRKR